LKQGFRDSLLVGAIYVGIFMSLGLIFARVFPVLLLPGQSEEIYDIATRYVRTQVLFHVFLMALYLSREPVQAMGMSGVAMLCGVAELIARGVAALTFLPLFGAEAAGFSNPLAWASGAAVGMIIQAIRLKALTKEFGAEPKLE
jgi:Na+-driven multidrug efflux pump